MLSDLYGNFRTETFSEIYEDGTSFFTDYSTIGIPKTIGDTLATTLYYLLYARYANSHIASSDPTRFKYELFSIIWQYGPTWEKKLNLQEKVRDLTDTELANGGSNITNNASNPDTDPANTADNELMFISNQNVSKVRRSKLQQIEDQYNMLEDDVSEEFLQRFKKLFLNIVIPENPLWYVTETEEDD